MHVSFSSRDQPPLLDVMIVGALLQSPGLPLLGGGVVAVVVQQEGPHLAADGGVDPAEEDGLVKRAKAGRALKKKTFSGQTATACKRSMQRAARWHGPRSPT